MPSEVNEEGISSMYWISNMCQLCAEAVGNKIHRCKILGNRYLNMSRKVTKTPFIIPSNEKARCL